MVAIPFFLVVLGCIVFAGQTYATKIDVMRGAREKVWTYASGNCGTPGDGESALAGFDPTGIVGGAETNGQNGGVSTSPAGSAGHGPGSEVLDKQLGSATVTAQSDVAASGVLGGMRASPSARRKVMCNEPPYDGDLAGAAKAAWREITGW